MVALSHCKHTNIFRDRIANSLHNNRYNARSLVQLSLSISCRFLYPEALLISATSFMLLLVFYCVLPFNFRSSTSCSPFYSLHHCIMFFIFLWLPIYQLDRSYSEKKLPPSWCHWMPDDGSESSRKKNTAPSWFEKQGKILGAKGGSWRSKKMETTVYQSNISIFHKSLDLLISSVLNNNNTIIRYFIAKKLIT